MSSKNKFVDSVKKVIKIKGLDSQLLALSEELSELMTAISHFRRDKCSRDDVLEEIADSLIMISEFCVLLNVTDIELKRKIISKLRKFVTNTDKLDEAAFLDKRKKNENTFFTID
jgi:NTP pyrophosphatase (non-canonical NTP hydrolase)